MATGDLDAKYVSVKITPQTLSTILPATFLANISTNAFAVGAEAVAGFAGTSVCSVAPIFVCNPYEASAGSMTDAQATAALYSAFDNPAILRRQLKLNRNGVGPGRFGWLNTADGCDDATCMAKNVAGVSGACYSDEGVSLGITNKNAVEPYFDARFDIYNQDPPIALTSANPPGGQRTKGLSSGTQVKHRRLVQRCAGERVEHLLYVPLGSNRRDGDQGFARRDGRRQRDRGDDRGAGG